MNRLFVLFITLLFSNLAFAELNCRTECTRSDGDCMQLGIRGRAPALHLNEILNSAHPNISLPWPSSKCIRTLNVQNDTISDKGEDCVEFMDPFPGRPADHDNASKTTIKNDLSAASSKESGEVTVRFDQTIAPDFSYFVNGQRHSGGAVELISHIPDAGGTGFPRLLIQTAKTCFSID